MNFICRRQVILGPRSEPAQAHRPRNTLGRADSLGMPRVAKPPLSPCFLFVCLFSFLGFFVFVFRGFLAVPHILQDLSSLTRDQTWALVVKPLES